MPWHGVTSSIKTINLEVGAFCFSEYLPRNLFVDWLGVTRIMGSGVSRTTNSKVPCKPFGFLSGYQLQ